MLLYLLLEHQSTNHEAMPLRMLDYVARIGKRYFKEHGLPLPLIVPLVVSHAPDGWTAPTSFHQLCAPDPTSIVGVTKLVPSFEILVEDLAHLTNEQLRAWALSWLPTLTLWVLRDARDLDELVRNALLWADAAAEALQTPNGMDTFGLLFRYVALITDRLNFEQFRDNILSQATETERATMTMTAAQEWMQAGRAEGRVEGRNEGRVEGRVEGRIETLRRQLELKFGEVATEHQARLSAASEDQLERYTERILTAQTIEDLFADPA